MAGDEVTRGERGKVFGVTVMDHPGMYLECVCETRNVAAHIADALNTRENTDRYIVAERVLEEYKSRDRASLKYPLERWLVIAVGATVWIEAVCLDMKSAMWRAEEASRMYDQIEYYIHRMTIQPDDKRWYDFKEDCKDGD